MIKAANNDTGIFLNALFNEGELLTPGRTLYDVEMYPVEYVKEIAAEQRFQYVAVNPFGPQRSRTDTGVGTLRNFLIEFDTLGLYEQIELVEEKLHLPFTTKTFSGSKSVHYIISLAEPVPTLEAYREISQKLLDVMPDADTKCRNPSRFTRLAGMRRDDTGMVQELLEVRERVTAAQLERFFQEHAGAIAAEAARRADIMRTQSMIPNELIPDDPAFRGKLTLRTKNFVRGGAARGGRNAELHFCACDYRNNLFPIDEAFAELLPAALASGLTEFESRQTIRSAYKTAPIRPRL